MITTFCLCWGLAVQAETSNEEMVRVRLQAQIKSIELRGLQLQVQGQLQPYQAVSVPDSSGKLQISRFKLKNQWLWKVQNGAKTSLFNEPYLVVKGIGVQAGSQKTPNRVILSAPLKSASFDMIGMLPVEDYLVGVLASEMPLRWPIESLKAQAIAARSYTRATMKEREKRPYHVESSVQDQVFRHVAEGVDADPLIERAREAVLETKDVVLLNIGKSELKNKVYKAFYHSDCGGKTSSTKQVWGFGESKGVVSDASCAGRPENQWSLKINREELLQKIAGFLGKPIEMLGSLASLDVVRPDFKSRVQKIKLRFEKGVEASLLADQFRALIGYSELRSTKFDVAENSQEFTFKGRGFGHGVGLCQWGSRSLALQNKTYTEILNHYYPNVPFSK